MSSASLHIDKQIADEVGVYEAMLLDRFFYYSASQIKNNPNLPPNDVWFSIEGGYNTLVKSLPRASKNKVHRWINSLVQSDCIKAEVRNKFGWNRTYSYKVNEKFEGEVIKKLSQISKKSNPVASASHATASATPPKPQPKTATETQNQNPKKDLAVIDAEFETFAVRLNSTADDILTDCQAVVNEYHQKLYKESISPQEIKSVNYAIKEIAMKTDKKGGVTSRLKLLREMIWIFHAIFCRTDKPDKMKFRASYLNNRFDDIFEEGQHLKERDASPHDKFKLTKQNVPPELWKMVETLSRKK